MRFFGFVIGVMLVCVGFWLGGFDFNERGFDAVACLLIALFVGALFASAITALDLDDDFFS